MSQVKLEDFFGSRDLFSPSIPLQTTMHADGTNYYGDNDYSRKETY